MNQIETYKKILKALSNTMPNKITDHGTPIQTTNNRNKRRDST